MNIPGSEAEVAERIVGWLRCPQCHGQLEVSGTEILCPTSGFRGSIREEVAVMMPDTAESFFDAKHTVMKHGRLNPGEWALCYAQQTEHLARSLKPGMRVVDIGCGPSLPYDRQAGVGVVGLEPSFQSIRENLQVDLRVFGTAYSMPMGDASADAIICFYSVHHMAGATREESRSNASRALREFGRVLKPGGALYIFEMSPKPHFWCFQRLFWNTLKRMIGKNLDMHFSSADELEALGRSALPAGVAVTKTEFKASPFTLLPPVFSLPKFKVPRFIYPLNPVLVEWRMPADPRPGQHS